MNNIQPGDLILKVGDRNDFVDALIIEGAHITNPYFPEDKIPTHCVPTFPIDENFINVMLEKFAITDTDYPDSREWIKKHLYGKPAVGGTGIIEMKANGLCGGAIESSDYLNAKNIFVLEPVISWNAMALKQLSVWGAFYFKHQIPYDYLIYPEQAEKIGLGWILHKLFGLPIECSPWLGETTDIEGFKDESQWKQECIELGERMINWACFGQGISKCFTGNVNDSQPIEALEKCLGSTPFFRVKKDSPLQLNN